MQNGSYRAKIKACVIRAAFLLESSRGEYVCLCFPVSTGRGYSSIYDPYLYLQNQQRFLFKPLSPPPSLTLASILLSAQLLIPTLLPLSYKNLCDYSEPTQIIRDNLPISKPFTESHLQRPYFHMRKYPQVLAIRMSYLSRGLILAYHTSEEQEWVSSRG